MNKNDVLAVIAVVAIIILALFWNRFILIALVLFFPLLLWRIYKKKDKSDKDMFPKPMTYEEAVGEYGEPDYSIVVDVMRANEAAGIVLVYKQKRLLVAMGEPLSMDDITDVSTLNTATPYTLGYYQVVLTTKKPEHEYVRMDVGMDLEAAKNVAMQILDAIKK